MSICGRVCVGVFEDGTSRTDVVLHRLAQRPPDVNLHGNGWWHLVRSSRVSMGCCVLVRFAQCCVWHANTSDHVWAEMFVSTSRATLCVVWSGAGRGSKIFLLHTWREYVPSPVWCSHADTPSCLSCCRHLRCVVASFTAHCPEFCRKEGHPCPQPRNFYIDRTKDGNGHTGQCNHQTLHAHLHLYLSLSRFRLVLTR